MEAIEWEKKEMKKIQTNQEKIHFIYYSIGIFFLLFLQMLLLCGTILLICREIYFFIFLLLRLNWTLENFIKIVCIDLDLLLIFLLFL